MSTSIPINTQTLQDARTLGRTRELLGRTIARLSSGERIVLASDDPAGIALGEKLSSQNLRVQAASTNVQNALSFTQSVDGFIGAMSGILNRMSELAILSREPIKNPADVAIFQEEFVQLQAQLRTTIGGSTADIGGQYSITKPLGTFNGNVLFGSSAGMVVATGQAATQRLTIPETNLRDGAMRQMILQDSAGNFTLTVNDPTAVTKIRAASNELGEERGTLGAIGSRLELAGGALVGEGEGLTGALSNIRDADIAGESTRLARYKLLNDSGLAMLAQANESPRSVLKLLG